MNTATKTLAAMRNNPRDWDIDALLTVARRYGMECRNAGGSHHVFSHPALAETLSVPAHRPIKPLYVRRFVALIDQIQE
ncbi:MAG: hypothetical protein RR101_14940 [Burkholderiaceae bacterium]